MSFDVATHSEADTIALGKALGPVLRDGDVLALRGDLGAGKTTFTQGLAAALGVSGRVTSPTFCIVQEHSAPALPKHCEGGPERPTLLVHMDLYRLQSESDVETIK